VNNVLSIAQQWVINTKLTRKRQKRRKLPAEAKRARA